MVSDKMIVIRVDAETKALIERAATTKGWTMTHFILHEATKAARNVKAPAMSGACPTFFRASCYEASGGGSYTYAYVGRHLPSILVQTAYENDEEDLKELEALLKKAKIHLRSPGPTLRAEDEAVVEYLQQALPRCMDLIPRRRLPTFLAGFYREVEENGFPF